MWLKGPHISDVNASKLAPKTVVPERWWKAKWHGQLLIPSLSPTLFTCLYNTQWTSWLSCCQCLLPKSWSRPSPAQIAVLRDGWSSSGRAHPPVDPSVISLAAGVDSSPLQGSTVPGPLHFCWPVLWSEKTKHYHKAYKNASDPKIWKTHWYLRRFFLTKLPNCSLKNTTKPSEYVSNAHAFRAWKKPKVWQ